MRLALSANPAITTSAAEHAAGLLLHDGFTIAQVGRNFGGICQTITELAGESDLPITINEFRTLNACLDDAIAGAVTEYSRVREYQGTERLGRLAHELRNLLSSAGLAYEMLVSGSVGINGSTGAVLGCSLVGIQNLVDRELAEVRLGAGLHRETVVVRRGAGGGGRVGGKCSSSRVLGRLGSGVCDRGGGPTDPRVRRGEPAAERIQVHAYWRARCAACARDRRSSVHRYRRSMRRTTAGKVMDLFGPFAQRSTDRSGLGLGLSANEARG